MSLLDKVLPRSDLVRAYQQVFGGGSMAQNMVMGDLGIFCGEQQSSVRVSSTQKTVDPYAMAVAEGRREVWLRIRAMIEMDSSAAWSLAQRERMQAAAARQGAGR
jgi:hypothetical protein